MSSYALIARAYMKDWKTFKRDCHCAKKHLRNISKQNVFLFRGFKLIFSKNSNNIKVSTFLNLISRFYFISSADLLDILSNGNEPEKVMRHLPKLFDSMAALKMDKSKAKTSLAMQSKDGEWVSFPKPCDLNGQVEIWLNRLLDMQCKTILYWLTSAVVTYEEKSRENWIMEYPGQIALTGSQIWWTTEVNVAFMKLEEGFENALKDYYKKQVTQLNTLITMLLGDLSKGDRQKIMTVCTIDVHARDVVTKMITQKVFAKFNSQKLNIFY